MKPETELSNAFIKAWNKLLGPEQAHIVRIESNYTQQGIPDLNIKTIVKKEFWIEFKVAPNTLEPLQVSWQEKRRDCGGLVFNIYWHPDAPKGYCQYLFDTGVDSYMFKTLDELVQKLWSLL